MWKNSRIGEKNIRDGDIGNEERLNYEINNENYLIIKLINCRKGQYCSESAKLNIQIKINYWQINQNNK